MKYTEIKTKSALHKLKKGRLPYSYDLNIYRGCVHKCQYCYALYSHQYLESKTGFYDEIFVKVNILENLERELYNLHKKGIKEIINLGGVCDSYQLAEAEYKLMPEILKLFIKYEQPMIISTKSDLILRDFDLFCELAEKTYVNVAVTVTTMNQDIANKIEPGAISSERRLEILKAFKDTKVNTGLHTMPILPYITDNEDNFDQLFAKAKEYGVGYVLNGTLNLIGQTRNHFLGFIQRDFPEYYQKYLDLYKDKELMKKYKMLLFMTINMLKEKHGLTSNFSKPIRRFHHELKQGKLF